MSGTLIIKTTKRGLMIMQENSFLRDASLSARLLFRYKLWRSGIKKDKEAFKILKSFAKDLQMQRANTSSIIGSLTYTLSFLGRCEVDRVQALKIAIPFIKNILIFRNPTDLKELYWWKYICALEEQARNYSVILSSEGLSWIKELKHFEIPKRNQEKIHVTKDEFIRVTTIFLLECCNIISKLYPGFEKKFKNLAHLSESVEEYRKYLELIAKYGVYHMYFDDHMHYLVPLCEEFRNFQDVEIFYKWAQEYWVRYGNRGMRFHNLCGLYGLFRDVREVEHIVLTMQRHLPWWLTINLFNDLSGYGKPTKRDIESFVNLFVEAGGERLLEIQEFCPGELKNKVHNQLTEKVEKILKLKPWNDSIKLEKARADICSFDAELLLIALRSVWVNIYGDPDNYWEEDKIKWAFDNFSAYIRLEDKNIDWKQDNSRTRRYWSTKKTHRMSWNKFHEDICPRAYLVMPHLRIAQIYALISIVSPLFSVETFTEKVQIPITWRSDYIQEEAGIADIYSSFYHSVPVLKPEKFKEYPFMFQRPKYEELLKLFDEPSRLCAGLVNIDA